VGGVRLRDVEPDDVDLYVRLRCDPDVMAELGGPLPRAGIEAKVLRDVASARDGSALLRVIDVDGHGVGMVTLWTVTDEGEPYAEIGWMMLPGYQGRGLAKAAARAVLAQARAQGRWGVVHAHPGVTNGPSNGICRSLGFSLMGERDVVFADRVLRTNHWQIDPVGVVENPGAVPTRS
jgi:RimJ/RimL family protein N-acetyltransferase